MDGADPYKTIRPLGLYPFNAPFYYPLTAALAALPFAWFSPVLAGALFFAVGSGLLAYALLKDEQFRMPLFISSPFLVSAAVAQWPPLLLAASLLPSFAWLLACKPNVGIPLFFLRPSWRGAVTITAFLLVSLVVQTDWVAGWLGAIGGPSFHIAPLFSMPLGGLLLFSVMRVSRPGGRLLLLMALMPQSMWFHDQLPLWLLARNRFETWLLTFSSWLAYIFYRLESGWSTPISGQFHPGIYVIGFIYLPALSLVLLPKELTWQSIVSGFTWLWSHMKNKAT